MILGLKGLSTHAVNKPDDVALFECSGLSCFGNCIAMSILCLAFLIFFPLYI